MSDPRAGGKFPVDDSSEVYSGEQARAILVEHLAILVVREHRRRLAADREDRRASSSDARAKFDG